MYNIPKSFEKQISLYIINQTHRIIVTKETMPVNIIGYWENYVIKAVI